jgi:hypothetical protein
MVSGVYLPFSLLSQVGWEEGRERRAGEVRGYLVSLRYVLRWRSAACFFPRVS